MRKYFLSAPLIIFFCMMLVFFYFLIIKRDPSELPSVLINQKAPTFKTTTLFDNKPFIFEEESGQQTVIVNFFATWCIPCREEHPYISKLSKEKNIAVIGVNYKDNPQEAIQWLNELGNPYSKVAVDSNGRIGLDWGVYGLPETFIVNENNIIIYKQVGPITNDKYDDFYMQIEDSLK